MDAEYHKPRERLLRGDSKQMLGEIAELLFDQAIRHIKIELTSEGTLFWEGKETKRY